MRGSPGAMRSIRVVPCNLDRPTVASDGFDSAARIALVRPQVAESPSCFGYSIEQLGNASPILDVGFVNDRGHQDACGVYENMPLSSVDFLVTVETADPPFSVVFALWESMTPAEGSASRPSRCLHINRSVSVMVSKRPCLDQR